MGLQFGEDNSYLNFNYQMNPHINKENNNNDWLDFYLKLRMIEAQKNLNLKSRNIIQSGGLLKLYLWPQMMYFSKQAERRCLFFTIWRSQWISPTWWRQQRYQREDKVRTRGLTQSAVAPLLNTVIAIEIKLWTDFPNFLHFWKIFWKFL